MEYARLVSKVYNAFYVHNKNFPINMLCPIFRHDSCNGIVDMFIICSLVRNSISGMVEKINSIEEIFFISVANDENKFVFINGSNFLFDFNFSMIRSKAKVKDFPNLYMKTREFVFEKNLSKEQIEILKDIIYIYEELFEEAVKLIYHKYAYDFFEWAYEIINK